MKKLRDFYIAALFFSGLCITLYPFISNLLIQSNATRVVENYSNEVAQLDQEEIDVAKEAMRQYNEQLNDAVISSQNQEVGTSYLDLIDVGESIGFIEIPKIELLLPIYRGTSNDVLLKGVGHIEQSSFPTGGESTHSVLTGHRGLPSAELFTNLDKLEEGDLFYLHILDEVLAYRVDQILVVLPEETEALGIVKGMDYCTLVTCTPYAINTHRLLVRGVRTEYIPPQEVTAEDEKPLQYTQHQSASFTKRLVDVWPWIIMSLIIMAGVETFIFWQIIKRKRKQNRNQNRKRK